MNNVINFNDYAIKLSFGSHVTPQHGMCIMECVAYIAGEPHTDRPECADPFLTKIAIHANDMALKFQRQDLIPFVLRLAGSKTDRQTALNRVWHAMNWVIVRNDLEGCVPQVKDVESLQYLYKFLYIQWNDNGYYEKEDIVNIVNHSPDFFWPDFPSSSFIERTAAKILEIASKIKRIEFKEIYNLMDALLPSIIEKDITPNSIIGMAPIKLKELEVITFKKELTNAIT